MNEFETKDKKYVWHPFTQMKGWNENPQLVIAEGRGVKLIDTQGKEYYDGVSSLWVNIHGHHKAEIDQAIISQLSKIAHSTMLGLTNIPASQLAEELVNIAPRGLEKVFFSDDGSTAVEVAIKMAYQYFHHIGKKDKKKFITLSQAYHGDTLGTVSVGGIDVFHRMFKPLLFESIHVPSPSCYHCKYGENGACGKECLVQLEDVLKKYHENIAAMIIEPLIQAAAGMLTQPAGYMKAVRELTRKYGVLLIVDEVATGFGRTGKMFACEHEDVDPDFMTISKGITGGYMPLAATFTTQEIYDAFLGEYTESKTFYHGHSYTGNQLACAAALANLKVFRDEKVIDGLAPKVALIKEKLKAFSELAHVGDVRHCGMVVGIELMQDKHNKIPYDPGLLMGAKVCQNAREYGIIIRNIGDVVVFMPPLASTVSEIDEMLAMIYRALAETLG